MDSCAALAANHSDGAASSGPMPGVIQLPGQLGLTFARELYDNIRSGLAAGNVVLDAAAVDRLSTPCVQVLLAAGLAAASEKIPFRIVNASEVFSAGVVELGLESQFRSWMV